MGASTAAGVGSEARNREGILVRHKEYMVDRLNDQIEMLRRENVKMQQECDTKRTQTMIAEILLCVMTFILGYAIGAMI